MKEFWNQRYAEPEYVYGTEPNEYFRAWLDAHTHMPGRLFLPGEGEGRNAVYAAQKGWEVFALDQSEAGKKKALQLAKEKEVHIHYEVTDILAYPFEQDSFNLIGLFFFHLPQEIRTQVHQQFVRALKPGGVLLAELFSPRQIGKTSGGPQVRELLYDLDDMRQDFKELDIQYLGEETIQLNEGKYHEGEAAVVRLIAQKIKPVIVY
ncbi:MAG: class I SAM-dependent methyltransferase [Saprospirales bacterium]|nr:class I SAM-dependent methyltransferase [Saprospirales bacterium]